jgi:hypothetical protein
MHDAQHRFGATVVAIDDDIQRDNADANVPTERGTLARRSPNVISEAMKPAAIPAVRAWLNEQLAEALLQVGDAPHWNIGHGRPILSFMDDTPHRRHPADRDPPMPSEAELLAALARSEADLAAGRIVPASVVHEEFSAALERIEARRGQRRGTVARR